LLSRGFCSLSKSGFWVPLRSRTCPEVPMAKNTPHIQSRRKPIRGCWVVANILEVDPKERKRTRADQGGKREDIYILAIKNSVQKCHQIITFRDGWGWRGRRCCPRGWRSWPLASSWGLVASWHGGAGWSCGQQRHYNVPDRTPLDSFLYRSA
jgi:hypothetical protein